MSEQANLDGRVLTRTATLGAWKIISLQEARRCWHCVHGTYLAAQVVKIGNGKLVWGTAPPPSATERSSGNGDATDLADGMAAADAWLADLLGAPADLDELESIVAKMSTRTWWHEPGEEQPPPKYPRLHTIRVDEHETIAIHVDEHDAVGSAALRNAAPAVFAELRRLQKIEQAARWFAIAALDQSAPTQVGLTAVADLFEALGIEVPEVSRAEGGLALLGDEFMRKVEADEVTLAEYLDRLNASSAAWAAEVPGRAAPPLVTDPAHWARYGVTKASQLAVYLDECVERERQKGRLL